MTDTELIQKISEKYNLNFGLEPEEVVKNMTLVRGLVFNHDFAKRVFGKDWIEHIQKMAICFNPLKYPPLQEKVKEEDPVDIVK